MPPDETPAAAPAAPALPDKPADDTRDDAAAYIRDRAAKAEGAKPDAPAADAKPDEKKPDEKPKPKSGQDYAIARKEKALNKREREIEARQQAAERAHASLAAQTAELDKMNEAELIAWAAKRRGTNAAAVLRAGAHLIAGKEPPKAEKPEKDPEVLALKEEVARMKADRENREYAEAETAWRARVESLAETEADTYPHLTAMPPREVSAKALDVWQRYVAKMGVAPELSAVLEHLESEEASAFTRTREALEKRQAARSGAGSGAGSSPADKTTGSPTGTGKSPSAPTARSVSNADASHPATSRRELSERERVDDLADFFRSRAS